MQGFAPEAAWHQADRQEVTRQVEDILQVIHVAKLAEHVVQNDGQMILPQVVRAAHANVEIAVFRQWGDNHSSLNQRLDQEKIDLVAERGACVSKLRMVTANEFITDIERGMRPGTLGQIFDNLADALLALDQNNVSLAHLTLQRGQIVGEAGSVTLEWFSEQPGKLADHKAAGCIPGGKGKRHYNPLFLRLRCRIVRERARGKQAENLLAG